MFFHLGIPGFVSVINTGHLVASSVSFIGVRALKCEEEKLPGFSFSSLGKYDKCYLSPIDPMRSSLCPVTHHPPPSRCLLVAPETLWIAFICSGNIFLSNTAWPPYRYQGNTAIHFPCLQSSVRCFPPPDLSFQRYLLFVLWPLKYIHD